MKVLSFAAPDHSTVDQTDLAWILASLQAIRQELKIRNTKVHPISSVVAVRFGFSCNYSSAVATKRRDLAQQADLLCSRLRPMLHEDERLELKASLHRLVDLGNGESDMWIALTYNCPAD